MSRLRDHIDQLTEKMTTPSDLPDIGPGLESSERPEILLLLMGHLPVRAGLWRLPAARFLLPECRSILVARQDGDDLLLECIGSSTCLENADLQSMSHLAADSTVVIVPDTNMSADLLKQVDPDRVALVTGGDQAAIVGAYSQLKKLPVDWHMPVELIIVGSKASQITETAGRLIEAASRHLDRSVRFSGAIEKIEADTGLAASCAIPGHQGGLLELVKNVRRGFSCHTRDVPEVGNRRVVSDGIFDPALSSEPLVHPDSDTSPVNQSIPVRTKSECIQLLPFQDLPVHSSPSISDGATSKVESGVDGEAAVQSVSGQMLDSLSSHLPGMQSLPVYCPACKTIELAVDESGNLHLLAQDGDVSNIPVVQTWVREHHHLLQMAMPGVRLDGPDPAQVHVLGQNVKVLCDLRGTGWKPHLLVRVDQTTSGQWAHIPLDD